MGALGQPSSAIYKSLRLTAISLTAWAGVAHSETPAPPQTITYNIQTREISYNGEVIALGHSGRLKGMDNPSMVSAKRQGPLPEGQYSIAQPLITRAQNKHTKILESALGLEAMPLKAISGTETHHRGSFYIHTEQFLAGISPTRGTHGCIGLPAAAVHYIAELRKKGQIKELRVISSPYTLASLNR